MGKFRVVHRPSFVKEHTYNSITKMAANDWLFVDLFLLIYNFAWLVFLTYKHYGQVTTKAGHIFELHVQLIITVDIFFWILLVEEVLP